MADDSRYLPILYPEEKEYTNALREHRFVLQRCAGCSRVRFPIAPVCPHCLHDGFEWAPMSGHGRVSSFVVYHKAWAAWLRDRVPYAVVQVQIDEGPRLTTNLLHADPADVYIDMPVRSTFEDVTNEVTLLQFEPA